MTKEIDELINQANDLQDKVASVVNDSAISEEAKKYDAGLVHHAFADIVNVLRKVKKVKAKKDGSMADLLGKVVDATMSGDIANAVKPLEPRSGGFMGNLMKVGVVPGGDPPIESKR
jgi:hypothetical protein